MSTTETAVVGLIALTAIAVPVAVVLFIRHAYREDARHGPR